MAKEKRKKEIKPLFCRVCKRYFPISEKEFRAAGHYPNDERPHLLEPNLGRSSRRYDRALKRDTNLRIAVAEAKQRQKERKEALDGDHADPDPVPS